MDLFVASVLGYALGSIPTSVIAGQWLRGLDIREHGSGNAGASNVLRVLGWRAGVVVLAVDVAKGALAVVLTSAALTWLVAEPSGYGPALAGLVAVLGHLWPAWTGFRGGKGVATAAGAMGALHPLVLVVAIPIFVVGVASTRRISIGSIAAGLSLPLATVGLGALDLIDPTRATTAFAVSVALLVPWTHRSNLRRLREGTEARLGG